MPTELKMTRKRNTEAPHKINKYCQNESCWVHSLANCAEHFQWSNGIGWYGMVLDGIGWYWMRLDGIGWYLMVLDELWMVGWYWMVLDGIGQYWTALDGIGRLWVVLDGIRWHLPHSH